IPATGINPDSAARFTNIFRTNYSAFDPGDFGQVTLDNPNTNLFGRLDWQVGQNHVLTFRHNYVKASDVTTSRGNNYSFASNNNVTFGLKGGHHLTLGAHNEFFHFKDLFIGQFTGLWTFASLATLQAGSATSFTRTVPYPGTSTPIADFRVRQFGFYVQDQWDATPRLNLTYGLRLDVPTFPDHPRSNPDAQSAFSVNTQDVPS